MGITSIRIHPAIGIARLGNSPNDFFIGPERPWEHPNPPGGFKDSQCRVKRQAARFRIFAYHDDNTVTEVRPADADISWTVHLANRKAVTRNAGSATDLTIDPGARTLEGPNQQKKFDTGTITLPGASAVGVPLGEVRTDNDGRLIVLGGFGKADSPTNSPVNHFANNAGWYDDISDGPVTAFVKLHDSGDEFVAQSAWVIVGPPKFAPQIDNVITLYDTLFQMGVDQGWLTAPAVPSYTQHVHPILQRARDTGWVETVFGSHTWPDPVYDAALRLAIFNRLANPAGGGSNMPLLNQAKLTPTQYAIMEKWKDDNFVQDWVGVPAPPAGDTPAGLDRTALDHCVGAAFFPGIEAGGIAATPITNPGNYVGAADPLRLKPGALSAGDMSEFMALPWQADFKACGTNWWPVPRPNRVTPQGESSAVNWDRDVGNNLAMVNEWHTLGFVVRQGAQHVEVDRCDTTFIALMTPHLNFQDAPQGPMGMARKTPLAIAFEVRSTGSAVTLEVQPGDGPAHPRLTVFPPASVTVGPTAANEIATARLWVIYETGPVGEEISDEITVRHVASGQSWTVTVTANTVARKVAAAALVLDRSGSMNENRGDGQTKYQSLKEAAGIFVDVMLEGDGVGLVRYNQDAQPLQAITPLGSVSDPFDPGRKNTKDIINGPALTPSGATSIGDGIFEGRQVLNAAGAGYDVKALVVLTDGKENRERWIADVAPEINEQTHAVGLGTPENTSAPVLQALAGNHGGYMLITGAITGDNQFILQKFFLQVLAGISNAEIVLDPDGELAPGQEHRIPFLLTEADAGMDVILLTPKAQLVDFRLETPNGFILEPWRAIAEPAMHYVLSAGVTYYRIVLPTELFLARYDQAGTWHALLTIGRPRLTRPHEPVPARTPTGTALDVRADPTRRIPPPTGPDPAAFAAHSVIATSPAAPNRRTLRYSLLVHSYSNLSFRATLTQSGYEPGATVSLHASLAESGVPARPGSHVWVEITRPEGSRFTRVMNESVRGQFDGSFTAATSGLYQCRVRASGRSTAGHPFHRETSLTAAVWIGGARDADPQHPSGGPLVRWLEERDARLCSLLRCLLAERGVLTPELERRLRDTGTDINRLRRCLEAYCRPSTRGEPGDVAD